MLSNAISIIALIYMSLNAVIDALDRDEIHVERYENYVRIYDDLLDESSDTY